MTEQRQTRRARGAAMRRQREMEHQRFDESKVSGGGNRGLKLGIGIALFTAFVGFMGWWIAKVAIDTGGTGASNPKGMAPAAAVVVVAYVARL